MQDSVLGLMPLVIGAIAILISITVHEFSHGLSAYLQGDTTAKDLGRLTLNPLAHIDLVGTILVPLFLLIAGGPVIGWARPVPFDPRALGNARFGPLLVGLAGPAANLALFLIAGGLLKLLLPALGAENYLALFLGKLVLLNFVLMLFNLIPIPPLDGSRILFAALPAKYDSFAAALEQYGTIILLFVLFIEYTAFPFISSFIGVSFYALTHAFGIPILY